MAASVPEIMDTSLKVTGLFLSFAILLRLVAGT
jgi:hypothetical protein